MFTCKKYKKDRNHRVTLYAIHKAKHILIQNLIVINVKLILITILALDFCFLQKVEKSHEMDINKKRVTSDMSFFGAKQYNYPPIFVWFMYSECILSQVQLDNN